ncbi:hypothetical protein ACH42_01280 [Endozoicomonas sp. (ex Bugula neritina AB1)]|nr:hypothetical protein ACH42_01280 [Endozoicomonas sp. (ex Bugula neritina AB1)]
MIELSEFFLRQLNDPLMVLLIALGSYLLAEQLFIRLGRKAWIHPLFTSSFLIYLLIRLTPLSLTAFEEHVVILKTLLGPFTVALAIPLSRQLHHLRALAKPLLITLSVGGFMAVALGLVMAWGTGATEDVLLSLSTKAVTTAVALVLAEDYGAIIPLSVAGVIICGIYGGMIGPWVCRKLGITDPRVVGFAMGVNSHAGGTARAFELDTTMGVYASLGMCMSALYMPVLVPMVLWWFI